jgi:hypothetical protein
LAWKTLLPFLSEDANSHRAWAEYKGLGKEQAAFWSKREGPERKSFPLTLFHTQKISPSLAFLYDL